MTPQGREWRDRVLTALVLALVILAAITWLSTPLLATVLAVAVLMGAWEWAALAGLSNKASRGAYLVLTALMLAGVYRIQEVPATHEFIMLRVLLWWLLMLQALQWWLFAAWRIWLCQTAHRWPGEGAVLAALEGWLVLVPAWAGLVWLCAEAKSWLYILLALIWLADTAAYVVGRCYGRRHLADQISPAKSWEGVIGALGATLLLAVGIGILRNWPWSKTLVWAGVALVTVVASMVGDLTESLYKRRAGVKDSGHCLPGHGGILDRIDSLTAAVPVYWLGLQGLLWLNGEWQW
jgi:phosphatidate cytidylyltransferase